MQITKRTFPSEIVTRIFRTKNRNKFASRLFSTFLLFCLLISCSDDIDEVSLTFLEKNHNTQWVLSHPELSVYIRINNEQDHLIEQWRYDSELECYEYNSNIFNPGDYQIMENTEDQLVVSCDAILGNCNKLTFHLEGNTLQVDVKLSDWEEETVYFLKSTQNLNDLSICEVKDDENRNSDDCSLLCFWK
ncbi:hypothetical protein [Lutimonas zeaxanthinifaciens]|uniref:hypothetical protein n=1 Tax=Lutimonas zeaxanthinifaciens TaxID=3060215 RepID=UPI00265CA1C8|nr:hypothetical protein [Lutimonas sp. YSD2104]WKK66485.1 hypothetical protein QZH61_02420 [Lutimonas sp. YSD2104]